MPGGTDSVADDGKRISLSLKDYLPLNLSLWHLKRFCTKACNERKKTPENLEVSNKVRIFAAEYSP